MATDPFAVKEPPANERRQADRADAVAVNKAVDVLLAEYNALRAEIVSRSSAQAALVGVGLTALGVVVGLVVQKHADQRLLLALPPLALLVNLLWSIENRRIALAGRHIRKHTSVELKARTGLEHTSWEEAVEQRRQGLGVIPSLVADGALLAVFAAAGLVGLLVTPDDLVSPNLRTAEWVIWVAAIGLPVLFAFFNALGR